VFEMLCKQRGQKEGLRIWNIIYEKHVKRGVTCFARLYMKVCEKRDSICDLLWL
jgi:hypothetical protein